MKEAHRKEIERAADEAIVAAIAEVPQMTKELLRKAVGAILGLKVDWHDVRVESSYGNQVPLIMEIVKSRCKPAAEKVVLPLVKASLDQISRDPKKIAAIAKRVEEVYYDTLERNCVELARNYAKAEAEAIVKGATEVNLRGIFPILEAENPESYKTKLGELLLEEVARHLAKGKVKRVVRRGDTVVMEDDDDE